MTAPAALFALTAAAAFVGTYRLSGPTARHTLRLTGAAALWATCIALAFTWR